MAMSNDTERTNLQEATLDLLKDIRDRLGKIEDEQRELCGLVENLARDLNTMHKFQQSFSERLGLVEKFCVDRPLQSAPLSRASSGG